MVKVDDTTSGIEAGLHAGCWTVGIAKTVRSNYNYYYIYVLFCFYNYLMLGTQCACFPLVVFNTKAKIIFADFLSFFFLKFFCQNLDLMR